MPSQPTSSRGEPSRPSAFKAQQSAARTTSTEPSTATPAEASSSLLHKVTGTKGKLINYRVLYDKTNNTVTYTNIMDDEKLATHLGTSDREHRGRSPPMQAVSTDDESESDSDVESECASCAENVRKTESKPVSDKVKGKGRMNKIKEVDENRAKELDDKCQGDNEDGFLATYRDKTYWVPRGRYERRFEDMLAEIGRMVRNARREAVHSESMDSLSTVDEELRRRNKGRDKGKGIEQNGGQQMEWKSDFEAEVGANKGDEEGEARAAGQREFEKSSTDPRDKDPSLSESDITVFQGLKGPLYSWVTHVCSFDQNPSFEFDEHCYTCGKLNYPIWEKYFEQQMQSFIKNLMKSKRDKQPSDTLIARRMQADEIAADMAKRPHEKAAREMEEEEEENPEEDAQSHQPLTQADFHDRVSFQGKLAIAAFQLEKAGDPAMLKLLEMRKENIAKLDRKYAGLHKGPPSEERRKKILAYFQERGRLIAGCDEQVKKLLGW
ncbi:hypothetical protein DL98DRAFT_531582 [Cadophora sp. DSE1049]|nr:hypothetical protein DL98DRAFT_531582 [Cadophora sp. DSE1049]